MAERSFENEVEKLKLGAGDEFRGPFSHQLSGSVLISTQINLRRIW